MDYFQTALASARSTIIHGHFGRYPYLVKFYLDSIPELEPVSNYELIFWFHPKSRFLHILIEPPLDAFIPSEPWVIVLTSHLHLRWNPLTTRVVHCVQPTLQVPLPQSPSADDSVLLPPTSHVFPFLTYEMEPVRVDFSSVQSIHEAYLRLLTLFDVLRPYSKWSISIPEQLRQNLMKIDKQLNKILG